MSKSPNCIAAVILLSVLMAPSIITAASAEESDDWRTEAVSSQIEKQLKVLVGQQLGVAQDLELHSRDGFLAREAKCATVDDSLLATMREDALVVVKRLPSANLPVIASTPFREGFAQLLSPMLGKDKVARFRLKISRISLQKKNVKARALLFATQQTPAGPIQLNSTWETRWQIASTDSPPLLQAINVLAYETNLLKTSEATWFAEATTDLFNDDVAFQQQVKLGMNSWLNRIERFAGSNIYSRHGFALGDANGDGLDDLYLCQPGGLPNRLFYQQADGTLKDHSAASGVDWLNDTRSALFVDLDNDGDQDLVLGTFVGAFLCRNLGGGKFERAGSLPGIGRDISSLSATDFDNDGDLDIHVCVYESEDRLEGRSAGNVYDLRTRGGMNRLYRNLIIAEDEQWKFEDVTASVGLLDGNQRFSLAASWEDFDNDGDQDLYIANDFGINCLYQNEGGNFVDASAKLGVEDYGPGMSVAWGDYNRDGRPDLYVANMFSAAGNRVTRQQEFQVKAHGTSRESFQRFNKGNSLYTFNGERFEEIPDAAGAGNALWAWSSLLADIDNDGWQDALVANGYITGPGGGDL